METHEIYCYCNEKIKVVLPSNEEDLPNVKCPNCGAILNLTYLYEEETA